MAILTCTASGGSESLKRLFNNNASITRSYSDFSPASSETLNGITGTLVEAFFSYHIYCGAVDDYTYSGDGKVEFYDTQNVAHEILSDTGYGHQIGVSGYNGKNNVTKYVDPITGSFSKISATMYKSLAASSLIEYKYGFTNLKMEYHYLPYKVTWICEGGGSIEATITDHDTNTLQLTAYVAPGYDFLQWSDGVTTATRSDVITGDIDFVAQVTPHSYTVNYYDITSGEEVLYNTGTYVYGTSYPAPALPTYNNIPEGYGVNPIGWIRTSETGSIRYGTTNIYSGTSTSTIVEQYAEIYNLTPTDGGVVNLYFNLHPMQYTVTHKSFTGGSVNNFGITTGYRIYGNGDYFLASLPTSLTTGYKLTNQMTEEDGRADTTITNSWFISETAMRPGDEKVVYIDSLYVGDSTVYSFETPINYYLHFHIYGEENKSETLFCKYLESYDAPILTPLENYVIYGWYDTEQDISTWYVLNSNNTIGNWNPNMQHSLGTQFKNSATTDYADVHYYAYYVPKGYQISYHWLDTWGQGEFALPASGIHVYGRDGLAIETIPNYEEYNIDNVGTINWYYYENNDLTTAQLTNNWTTVPLEFAEDRKFYALKTPKGRHITFGVNEESWGKVIVENPKKEDIYQEGDIINVYIESTKLAYFSHWSDGNRLPIREIEVGGKNIQYIAYFRSNQIYVQRPKAKKEE